jgi:hypothetical protein
MNGAVVINFPSPREMVVVHTGNSRPQICDRFESPAHNSKGYSEDKVWVVPGSTSSQCYVAQLSLTSVPSLFRQSRTPYALDACHLRQLCEFADLKFEPLSS